MALNHLKFNKKHKVPMLSLSNAFGEADLKNLKKKFNFLSQIDNSKISYTANQK